MGREDAERAAIQAAADRLLAGTPLRSTGELTVVQLAAEASVKRWLLTHKHRDLTEQFQARAKARYLVRARSLPELTWGSAAGTTANCIWISLEIASISAGATPL